LVYFKKGQGVKELMPDLGTNISFIPQQQANLPAPANSVNDKINDPKYDNVKKHMQKNTIGKLVGDTSEEKQKKPFSFLYTLLYGTAAALGADSISRWAVSENRFEKFLEKVDNNKVLQAIEKPFISGWNAIKDTALIKPFTAIKNHFVEHSTKLIPVNKMARDSCRSMAAELTEELIEHSSKIFKNKIGSKAEAQLNILLEKLRQGQPSFNWKHAYPELFKQLEASSIKPEDYDKAFNVKNSRIQAITGFVKDQSHALIKSPTGNSFFSKALRGMYSGATRFFRVSNSPIQILMTSYFVGDAVKKTIDAPKGDKMSTFMENALGDIVPFWMLMNTITRFPYQALGGLKAAPEALGKSFGKIGTIIGKPFEWAAKALSIGLDGKLTTRMSEATAKSVLGEANAAKYMEKVKAIANGIDVQGNTKLIKDLFKTSVPFLKRFGYKALNFGGGLGRAALIMAVLMPLIANPLKKLSHKLFGKPQSTIAEEEKEKAEKNKSKNPSPMEQYIKQIEGANIYSSPQNKSNIDNVIFNPSQNYQESVTSKPSMIKDYAQRIKNNGSYNKLPTDNSVAARTLDSQKDYSSTPMPLTSNNEKISEVNNAIMKADSALLGAEQALKHL